MFEVYERGNGIWSWDGTPDGGGYTGPGLPKYNEKKLLYREMAWKEKARTKEKEGVKTAKNG